MRHSSTFVVPCVLILAACAGSGPAARGASPPGSVAVTSGTEETAIATAPSATAESPAELPVEAAASPWAPETAAVQRQDHASAACGELRLSFAHGSAALDAPSEQQLDRYAACVASERAHVLYIVDSTYRTGSAASSLALAHARGRAVADYLHGIGCHTEIEIRTVGATHTSRHHRVWPDERAVVVSDVRPQLQ